MSAGARIDSRAYGQLPDGRTVREYTLSNAAGLSLSAINLGGIVTRLYVPDRQGAMGNVVLGLPGLSDYLADHPHFGTIVGRYGNRIAQGRFRIAGEAYQIDTNDGPHALHGGAQGFGRQWWDIEALPPLPDGSVAIELTLASPDGDQGFPGRLDVRVRYTLTSFNAYRIDYQARSDRPTVVNLTHHDYFNLSGGGNALGHRLQIAASQYCPVDSGLIPEGVAAVAGTPFDFQLPTVIEQGIRTGHDQLILARGYDHNWVLDPAEGLRFAARLEEPVSGRSMDIETTEPGLQFYSGNFLDGRHRDASGRAIRQGDGLCLETQHFPDAPNRSAFPSTLLQPGETFTSTTVHRFGVLPDVDDPSDDHQKDCR
ncbi:MAG: galactose mutarotase [Variovorax sp.]|nr:galactose mutarotase [Variovorax sp.]